jgi:hypothetical protein
VCDIDGNLNVMNVAPEMIVKQVRVCVFDLCNGEQERIRVVSKSSSSSSGEHAKPLYRDCVVVFCVW